MFNKVSQILIIAFLLINLITVLMTESPDLPWAKNHDERIKKKTDCKPSEAALFFHEFLKSRGINSGHLADICCGHGGDAIFFVQCGFDVYAVDRDPSLLGDLDLHGVKAYSFSPTDFWLFEESFLDFVFDLSCYKSAKKEEKETYRNEILRCLKPGGLAMIAMENSELLANDFTGFNILKKIKLEKDGKTCNYFIMEYQR